MHRYTLCVPADLPPFRDPGSAPVASDVWQNCNMCISNLTIAHRMPLGFIIFMQYLMIGTSDSVRSQNQRGVAIYAIRNLQGYA